MNVKNETTESNDKDTAVFMNVNEKNHNKPNQEELKSRNNILNDGKQLSLMTVNSNVMENSADLLFDSFIEDS